MQDRSQRDVGILDGRRYASLVESEPGMLGIGHYGSHHELRCTTMVFLAALQQSANYFGLILSEIFLTLIIPCRETEGPLPSCSGSWTAAAGGAAGLELDVPFLFLFECSPYFPDIHTLVGPFDGDLLADIFFDICQGIDVLLVGKAYGLTGRAGATGAANAVHIILR